mgnify:CR=1 FL=1
MGRRYAPNLFFGRGELYAIFYMKMSDLYRVSFPS